MVTALDPALVNAGDQSIGGGHDLPENGIERAVVPLPNHVEIPLSFLQAAATVRIDDWNSTRNLPDQGIQWS
jgi:hypothetical protein